MGIEVVGEILEKHEAKHAKKIEVSEAIAFKRYIENDRRGVTVDDVREIYDRDHADTLGSWARWAGAIFSEKKGWIIAPSDYTRSRFGHGREVKVWVRASDYPNGFPACAHCKGTGYAPVAQLTFL